MISISIESEFLDMFPDASVDLNYVSPVFGDASRSFIPGTYSFPFKLPTTPLNRRLLQYADIIQVNSDSWDQPVECYLYFDGKCLLKGSITKTSAINDDYIEVYFSQGTFIDLKDVPMNQIPMDSIAKSTTADWQTYALATANAPQDYPVVFYPVNNPDMYEESKKPVTTYEHVQNYFNHTTGQFDFSANPVTPFPRIAYSIQKIFDFLNITLDNYFQITTDLNKLTSYSNQAINLAGGLISPSISVNDHHSKTKASEWLKSILKLFYIIPDIDPFNPVCTLVPIKDLVNKEPSENWTGKANIKWEIFKSTQAPLRYKHKELSEEISWIYKPAHINDQVPTPDLTYQTYWEMQTDYSSITIGQIIYVRNVDVYYLYVATNSFELLYRRYQPVETGLKSSEILQNDIYILRQHASIFNLYPADSLLMMPEARWKCNIVPLEQFQECPDAITFYRGMRNYTLPITFDLYPFAHSDINYLEGGYIFDTLSLRWDTEYGLYNIWHKDFFEKCLKHYTEVKWKVRLNIVDLLRFRFTNVIRIGSVNYLVKSLSVKLTSSGLSDSEAILVPIRG